MQQPGQCEVFAEDQTGDADRDSDTDGLGESWPCDSPPRNRGRLPQMYSSDVWALALANAPAGALYRSVEQAARRSRSSRRPASRPARAARWPPGRARSAPAPVRRSSPPRSRLGSGAPGASGSSAPREDGRQDVVDDLDCGVDQVEDVADDPDAGLRERHPPPGGGLDKRV